MSLKTGHSQIMTLTDKQTRLSQKLAGPMHKTIQAIEESFGVELNLRGDSILLSGPAAHTDLARTALDRLFDQIEQQGEIDHEDVYAIAAQMEVGILDKNTESRNLRTGSQESLTGIQPKNKSQKQFIKALLEKELVFGVGPAGTGKTFLAVAAGVHFLKNKRVDKLIITRPAVEAGERLGFLPGDLAEKVDPYLQPIWDSLNELMGAQQVAHRRERGIIELAPLAYMRGRTLKNAMIILDEAQNTTRPQMRMALTRIGKGSIMAVAGDPSQVDLPSPQISGLLHAARLVSDVKSVEVIKFGQKDVVRRRLVADIVNRYERDDSRHRKQQKMSYVKKVGTGKAPGKEPA